MTGAEIIKKARQKADDLVGAEQDDYSWTTEEFIDYLNDAVEEICIEAKLLKDSDTLEICTIPIVALTSVYNLDKRIISVDQETRPRLTTLKRFLFPTTEAVLIINIGDGWPDAQGDPTHYIADLKRKKLTLFRKPKSDDTLILTVYRLPLIRFTTDNIGTLSPEIGERLHYKLVDGILAHAYQKNDADTKDLSSLKVAISNWGNTVEMEKRRWIQREGNPQEIVSIAGGLLP